MINEIWGLNGFEFYKYQENNQEIILAKANINSTFFEAKLTEFKEQKKLCQQKPEFKSFFCNPDTIVPILVDGKPRILELTLFCPINFSNLRLFPLRNTILFYVGYLSILLEQL